MSLSTPATRVQAYIRLRDFKKTQEDAFKKSMERVHLALEKLEAELLDDLNQSGANSIACDEGTVYRHSRFSATVENRADFLNAVREGEMWEALDVRANGPFIRDQLDKGIIVPGVKTSNMATVSVRRPSK